MSSTDTLITSTANVKIKRIRALAMKKHRNAEGVFIIEGLHPVQKALAQGWQVETLLFTSDVKNDPAAQKIITTCHAQKAVLHEVTDKVMSYITNRDNAQSIVAILVQKLLDIASIKDASPGVWLGLENIRDPGNLGTIIRTADAVGVQGILLIGNTCEAFSPEVIRATTGSFSAVPLIQISLSDFLIWRTSFTGTIIGTHLHKRAIDYREIKIEFPVLLLMGGEQTGLSTEISAVCNILAKIPMQSGVESLNLAVATGIMLYELNRSKPLK